MRTLLAQRLLGTVLSWSDSELADQLPIIDALARLKYDEYQQYKPGMKFIESLGVWVWQFTDLNERRIAYDFIRNRLIFISSSELTHLVDITYPSIIRAILMQRVAELKNIPYWQRKRIADSFEFKELKRRSLFLALSDGARIDRFRRVNRELSNEQINSSYDLSDKKVQGLVNELRADIAKLNNIEANEVPDKQATFKTIFLLDDFSGSGLSLIRKDDKGNYEGKLQKMYQRLFDGPLNAALDPNGCDVYVILYIMTEKARTHTEQHLKEFWNCSYSNCFVYPVLSLNDEIRFGRDEDAPMSALVEEYYNDDVMDKHMRVGGTEDARLGFAGVGLPLVLSHNTPNDSLFLLWSWKKKPMGLFPRLSRHKEDL